MTVNEPVKKALSEVENLMDKLMEDGMSLKDTTRALEIFYTCHLVTLCKNEYQVDHELSELKIDIMAGIKYHEKNGLLD
jgi:hypothetical protein